MEEDGGHGRTEVAGGGEDGLRRRLGSVGSGDVEHVGVEVDLSLQTSVPDERHDPLLSLLSRQVQTGRQVATGKEEDAECQRQAGMETRKRTMVGGLT